METRPTIHLKDSQTGEKGRYRMDQERILIGRDRACFITIKNHSVSRRHAEIFRDGNDYFVRDLKSDNKTYLNDSPLPPEEKTLLKGGDRLRLGTCELRFETSAADEASDIYEITDSNLLEVKMVKKLLKALDRDNHPSLEIVAGPFLGKKCVLEGKSQTVTIGRDLACEFRIDADVVSRRHAKVTRKLDTVWVEDLGSRNGVFVGKEKIQKKTLRDGDRIHLGTLILMFRNPLETAKELVPLEEEPPTPPPKKESEKPEPKSPEPEKKKEPVPRRFSPLEILGIVIGLILLVGSLWGILKIL